MENQFLLLLITTNVKRLCKKKKTTLTKKPFFLFCTFGQVHVPYLTSVNHSINVKIANGLHSAVKLWFPISIGLYYLFSDFSRINKVFN